MRIVLIISSILLFALAGFGQVKVIIGRVLDSDSQKPIPFPTIKLDNGDVWAIGNSSGEFSIELPDHSTTITFSSVGYKGRIIKINELAHSDVVCIYMKEDILVLPEIIVSPASMKTMTLGYAEHPSSSKTLHYGDVKYSAFANRYRLKKRPARIEEANVYIKKNTVGDYTLRCRITDKTSYGSPGEDLLSENVFITTNQESGWIKFDLRKYDLWIENRIIYLVIEILHDGEIISSDSEEISLTTPGFSYLKDINSAFISTTPGVWRQNDNRVVSNLKISYMD